MVINKGWQEKERSIQEQRLKQTELDLDSKKFELELAKHELDKQNASELIRQNKRTRVTTLAGVVIAAIGIGVPAWVLVHNSNVQTAAATNLALRNNHQVSRSAVYTELARDATEVKIQARRLISDTAAKKPQSIIESDQTAWRDAVDAVDRDHSAAIIVASGKTSNDVEQMQTEVEAMAGIVDAGPLDPGAAATMSKHLKDLQAYSDSFTTDTRQDLASDGELKAGDIVPPSATPTSTAIDAGGGGGFEATGTSAVATTSK